MMNAGNLKGKTKQMSDWRQRLLALVLTLSLLISSCGLTAFAELDEDIYSAPVTVPPEQSTSPDPAEGETAETPAPEGQTETGTEEGGETEGEPEESEEPEEPEPVDLTVYEPGTLTAETDGIQITLDYTAEARVPEGTVLTLARAAGGDLYSAMKSAAKVLRTEINETWQREMGDEAVFYAIALTNPEGNEVHPKTGVTLTCENLIIPADATGFVTGDNAENIDWDGTLTVDFLPDAVGYAYLKQVQIGNITLVHEGADYTVTATYGPDAGFPAGTELKVREILPGTDEYALYSGMTEEAVSEDWSEITLERYFDIAFVHGEEELEPNADVDVQITFKEAIELTDDHELQAVHIENNEATVIEAGTDSTESAVSDDEAIDTVSFTSDSFSVFGVVRKTKIVTKVLDAQGNTYEIEVTYNQEAEIPENAQVKVDEIEEGSDLWEAYRKQTAAALNADDVRLPGLYDISIVDEEGNKVEPKAPVSVSIKLANAENTTEELHVVHFTEEMPQELIDAEAQQDEPAPEQPAEQPEEQQGEQTEVQDQPEEPASEQQDDQPEEKTIVQNSTDEPLQTIESETIDAKVEGDTVTFDTQGFSVYAFAYTVDFYYDVDGNTYEYHIKGGSVQSLRALLPILSVVKDDPATENDEVADFVADIDSVTFSDESLVRVMKVSEDTTAGEIVDALDVEIEYSAKLTEEDIAGINATLFTAPDWAVVSLKPFFTEEALTIIMNDGEKLVIKVTDAAPGYLTVNDFSRGYLEVKGRSSNLQYIYSDFDSSNEFKNGKNSHRIIAKAKSGYVFSKWTVTLVNNQNNTWDSSVFQDDQIAPSGFDVSKLNDNIFTAVFEEMDSGKIGIRSDCEGFGWVDVGGYKVRTYNGAAIYSDIYWRGEDGKNKNTIVAHPNDGYEFVGWEYYRETRYNEWTLDPSLGYSNDTIQPGTYQVDDNNGKGYFIKAVFLPIGFSVSVNKSTKTGANLGDVVDESNNSCLGHMPLTQDGKLTKTIKAVPQSGETFICWKLDGQILPIASDTIHPNDFNFSGTSELQAVFATVIDANGSAQQNIHISDDKQKAFEKWMESLKNKEDVTVDKTAHVVDYENRIYEVDISASSAKIDFGAEIDLAFILDMSSSMLFPYHLVRMDHEPVLLTQETLNALFPDHNSDHFFISSPKVSSTVYRLFYDSDGKWYAIDEAWWQKDGGNPQGSTVQEKKFLALESSRYSDPVGGPYAYPLYTIDNPTHRQKYLNDCLSDTIQSMKDILTSVRNNGGSTAEINVANLNFCYEVRDFTNFRKLSENPNLVVSITNTEGGTRQDLALERARQFNWTGGHQKYAILITDGAPVAAADSGVDLETVYTNVGNNANALKTTDGVTLITVGLSTKNVTRGSQKMFEIASVNPNNSNQKLFFEAEEDGDLKNILYEIVETIIKHAQIGGSITDTVDPAFYPVDANGDPISAGCYDKNGNTLDLTAWQQKMNAHEPIYEWTFNEGVWTITWYNQHIGWDENNANDDNKPWKKSFHIKAKEDFLGGNRIPTNGSASVTPEAYYFEGGAWTNYNNPTPIPLPKPYVNVDELALTQNSTEWTVYLGTGVDPRTQLKNLYSKIDVLKVVSGSTDQMITNKNQMLHGKSMENSERFKLGDVVSGMNVLNNDEWDTLIVGDTISKKYDHYGHTDVGDIQIKLTRNEVVTGEKGLNESPHATEKVGPGVEKYTFTVTYIPTEEQEPAGGWHTTPGGSRGAVTDNMVSSNDHVINVFAKGLRVEKKDTQGQLIETGTAKFKLYTKVPTGTAGAEVLKVNDTDVPVKQYGEVLSTTGGILTIEQLAYPEEGIYYLVETEAPDGYIRRTEPMVIQLTLSDRFWAWNGLESNAVGTPDEALKPYYWKQILTGECNETPIAEDPVGLFNVIVPNTEKTSLTVKKNWGDGQYPPEGAEIKAKLTAKVEESFIDDEAIKELTGLTDLMVTLNGGKKVEEEYTGNDTIEKPWEYLWTDLPKYDEAKHEVSYSAIETSYKIDNQTIDLEKYEPTLTPGTQELIITNKLPKTERHAIKVWDDDGEEDRPASITFTLTAKVGEIPIEGDGLINEGIVRTEEGKEQSAEQTMSGPAWTRLDWTDLPVYTKAGKLITYDIVESSLEDYTLISKSWDNDTKTIATFTNKIGKTSVELPGIKTMNGGEMPGTYSFILSAANGTPMPESKNLVVGETQTTLTVQNTEEAFTFGSIVYKLSNMTGATPVEGEEEHKTEKTFTYTVTEKNDAQSGIIYDETIYTVAIKVIYDNQTGTLKLADGYPAYSKTVGAVTTTEGISSIAFENKEVTEVNITKAWQKNGSTEAPQDVTISLGLFDKTDLNTLIKAVKLNGREDVAENPTGAQELITTAGNYEDAYEDSAWHATWKNLRKYDGNGNEIEYVVKEIPELSGYTVIYSGEGDPSYVKTGGTVTNKLNETNVKIVKVKAKPDGTTEPLTGAIFTLTKIDENNNAIDTPITIDLTEKSEDTVNNLTDGKYRLEETQVPAGFIGLGAPIIFTITEGKVDQPDLSGVTTIQYTKETDETDATFTIGNTPGTPLPSTGGSGTLIYTIVGTLLIALAGVLLVSRRKRKA